LACSTVVSIRIGLGYGEKGTQALMLALAHMAGINSDEVMR